MINSSQNQHGNAINQIQVQLDGSLSSFNQVSFSLVHKLRFHVSSPRMKNETNQVNKLNVKASNNVIINYFSNLIFYEIRNIDIRLLFQQRITHTFWMKRILSIRWKIYTASSSLKQRFWFHCHGMVEDVQLTKEFGFQSDAQEVLKFLLLFRCWFLWV